jgi:hypothetical protein
MRFQASATTIRLLSTSSMRREPAVDPNQHWVDSEPTGAVALQAMLALLSLMSELIPVGHSATRMVYLDGSHAIRTSPTKSRSNRAT